MPKCTYTYYAQISFNLLRTREYVLFRSVFLTDASVSGYHDRPWTLLPTRYLMFTCIVLLLLMSTKPHPVGSYGLIPLSAFSSRVHTFFLLLQSSPHLHLSASSISHLFPHHFYFSPHLHLSVSYSIHFYTFLPALNAPHFLFIFIHTRDSCHFPLSSTTSLWLLFTVQYSVSLNSC